MIIHWSLLATVTISGGLVTFFFKTKKQRNKVFLYFSFFLIFLLQAFRSPTVGTDTLAYESIFYNIRMNPKTAYPNLEIAYKLLNVAVSGVTDNPQALLAVVSLIILTGVGYFIYNNTDNTILAVILFITFNHYFTSMVSLRQYCALAIGINIYTVLKNEQSKKNYIKAIALLIIAFLFHQTSFVCAFFIIIFQFKKATKRNVIMWIAVAMVSFFSFDYILQIGFSLFSRFESYQILGHEKYRTASFGLLNGIFTIIKTGLVLLVFKLNENNKNNFCLYRLITIVLIGTAMSVFSTKVFLFFRFAYYFDIFLIILIPQVLQRISKNIRVFLTIGVYLFGCAYFLYQMLENNSKCVPYKFFWQ